MLLYQLTTDFKTIMQEISITKKINNNIIIINNNEDEDQNNNKRSNNNNDNHDDDDHKSSTNSHNKTLNKLPGLRESKLLKTSLVFSGDNI